jgi:hypothetical protein
MIHRLSLALTLLISLGAACALAQEAASPETDSSGSIHLRWQIDSAEDNYGFYLERSDSEDGPWVRINEDLIPGVGTTSDIHRFEYIDERLVRGQDYWYRLHEVGYSGMTELMGTISTHCRTIEEDIVHERRRLLGLELVRRDEITSPIISGEWVAFLHPRMGQPVELIGEWGDWEENPIEMELLSSTQLWVAEEPLSRFEAGQEVGYLFLVGEGASAEVASDPQNSRTARDEVRDRDVSVFTVE